MDLNDQGGAGGDAGTGDAGSSDAGLSGGGGIADLLGSAAAGDGGDAGAAGAGAGDAGAGDAGAGGEAAVDPAWYDQVSGDVAEGDKVALRDWLRSAGVKDVQGLAKMARDNVAALRDSGRVKVPGEGASEVEVKAFHAAIGVPGTPEDYALPVVNDSDGNPVPLDEGLLGGLRAKAHEYGVPKAAFEGLVADFVQGQLDQQAQADHDLGEDGKAWQRAQGTNLAARTSAVDSAIVSLGLGKADLTGIRAVMGTSRALDMFAKLGEGMAEDVIATGGRGKFGVTGQQAQAQLDTLKTDTDFMRKAMVSGTPEQARWNRLNQAAGEWQEQQQRNKL